MWCANCRSDVAAEVSVDNRRIHCATCGTELTAESVAIDDTKTRTARELLERWSSKSLQDPFAERAPAPARVAAEKHSDPFVAYNSVTDEESGRGAAPVSRPPHAEPASQRSSGPKFRLDAAQPLPVESPRGEHRPHAMEFHTPHAPQASGPHFDVQTLLDSPPQAKSNSASALGQVMAYLGVATLTIGTALVLWGYFGDQPSYAPTGWLVTTAGQMLLFLGVVTLVSGGIEQSSVEVTRRIEMIGERILRIEQVSREHALRGPSIPADHFQRGGASRHEREIVEQQTGY